MSHQLRTGSPRRLLHFARKEGSTVIELGPEGELRPLAPLSPCGLVAFSVLHRRTAAAAARKAWLEARVLSSGSGFVPGSCRRSQIPNLTGGRVPVLAPDGKGSSRPLAALSRLLFVSRMLGPL